MAADLDRLVGELEQAGLIVAVMTESTLAGPVLHNDAASSDVGPWVGCLAVNSTGRPVSGWATTTASCFVRWGQVAPRGRKARRPDRHLRRRNSITPQLSRILAAPPGTSPPILSPARMNDGATVAPSHQGQLRVRVCGGDPHSEARSGPRRDVPDVFAESPGRVAFGVDAEPLLSLPWVSRTLNRAVIADHLSHRWLSWHETHYQDLSRVPAGFVVTWQGGARRFERYWYPVDPSGNVEWVREDALDQFQDVFEQAIERCLGQGRAAIFLSGGFDSVSIGVTAAELSRRRSEPPPIAASMFFPDSFMRRRANSARRRLAARDATRRLRLDDAMGYVGLIRAGVEMNRTSPMPMMNAWRPAYRALGDQARAAGARVTMTGEGGDEWLTVGPEYMVDLLRRVDLAGLRRMLGTVLRSYDTSRSLLLYNMLWRFAGGCCLPLWGRDAASCGAKALVKHRLANWKHAVRTG